MPPDWLRFISSSAAGPNVFELLEKSEKLHLPGTKVEVAPPPPPLLPPLPPPQLVRSTTTANANVVEETRFILASKNNGSLEHRDGSTAFGSLPIHSREGACQ